jgi:hypothetical protein
VNMFALVSFEENGNPLDIVQLKDVLDKGDLHDTCTSRRIKWNGETYRGRTLKVGGKFDMSHSI